MDESDAFNTLSGPLLAVDSPGWVEAILTHRCQVAKLWPHQLELSVHINNKKDVFGVMATGMGKTLILQAGAITADARGEKGIMLGIVPTKVLVEQQAELATARGLRALAINEDTVREAALENIDLWAELANGDDVRIAIMTPQMVLGKRMQQLLNTPAFVVLVRWVSIDEAALIDQKEGVFAPWYLRLSTLRVKLPTSTQWTAVTASATKERALVMAKRYGMKPGAYIDGRYSINRPNLKYIPRFYEHAHTGSEHLDLAFTIPRNIHAAIDIDSTIIFGRTIERGFSIMDYLDSLISLTIPNRGSLIKLYNSLMTSSYRRKLKSDFLSGKVRIIVVTDTAAYGFDLPNVRRVITTALEDDYEEGDQKYGRAGRDGELAEVVSFAPSWVRNLSPNTVPSTKGELEDEEKRAKLKEPIRAFYNPTPHFCSRRAILHYYSESIPPVACLCCPIHDPEAHKVNLLIVQDWKDFFEQARTTTEQECISRPHSEGAFRVLDKKMRASLSNMLDRWSYQAWACVRPSRDLPCSFFFPPFLLEAILDKAHLCTDIHNLKIITQGWDYFDDCAPILLTFLTEVMASFDAIFDEIADDDSDGEEHVALTAEARMLSRLANVAVLKKLCHENGRKISGRKRELVERLMLHFAR
ncbi:P-loop containing nucleoside triphosphate hydrolase protein [Mycena crocata]|nr:P-loop containing nucleoside triphosphate hydrolase protein [Mycena crocata]